MKLFQNRTVLGIVCILVSLAVCFGIAPLLSRSVSGKAQIVRVAKAVQAGEQIGDAQVQLVEVGSYNLPDDVLREKKNVVGKYALTDLAAGDYLLPTKLSDSPAAENARLYSLDGKKEALSVTIKSFATGLSGKLRSGDIVSVIVADYNGSGFAAVPPELQYVEVISVTTSNGSDANTEAKAKSPDSADEKELPSTVTFLVSPDQAKVLAELEQNSKLHLALVYRGDKTNADKFIKAQDAVITELHPTAEGAEAKGEAGT